MNFLAHLEKKQILWWLIGLSVVFFFLRLPSLIEPNWYGDEGIYEVIGQSLNHGSILYRDVWDNKPPLLYVVYALAQGDQSAIKSFSLIIGILSLLAFFFITQKLFNNSRISIFLSTCYVLLLATPLLEGNIANAEVFMLFPIITAAFLIYQKSNAKHSSSLISHLSLLLAGLLLGIAFLFKIVAIFDFAAFLCYLIVINLPKYITWKSFIHTLRSLFATFGFLFAGFLLPFVVALCYFAFNHTLKDFIQSAFFGNIDYVGWQNTFLGIPQGLLILKCCLLAIALFVVMRKRKLFDKPTLFVTLWFIFSLFNAYFSGRPYTHYVTVLLPSFVLVIGLLLKMPSTKQRLFAGLSIFIIIIALISQFHITIIKPLAYYQNVMQFISGKKSVNDYQSFFDQKTPRDYAIAAFLANHTDSSDTIFIWGNSAQIYALSHKSPITKYVVAYHITQNNAFSQTQQTINQKKPKYIIVLKESQPLPFGIPLYIMRYSIPEATIYERNI